MAGLDMSMLGGSLEESYGFPSYYGDLLIEADENGTILMSPIDDMVARLWRYMFKLDMVDNPVSGDADSVARRQAHLNLAQQMTEEGSVLLKNKSKVFSLSSDKYRRIAVFEVDATNQSQVSENHGRRLSSSTQNRLF